ncbi:hypothetical protein QBC43DRAFT_288547 [Cladorrhinum sp. PSN259]|nr:hypothetical protein QBC43DRAFT_288547 [Cladorrhinum sp. PSN259]
MEDTSKATKSKIKQEIPSMWARYQAENDNNGMKQPDIQPQGNKHGNMRRDWRGDLGNGSSGLSPQNAEAPHAVPAIQGQLFGNNAAGLYRPANLNSSFYVAQLYATHLNSFTTHLNNFTTHLNFATHLNNFTATMANTPTEPHGMPDFTTGTHGHSMGIDPSILNRTPDAPGVAGQHQNRPANVTGLPYNTTSMSHSMTAMPHNVIGTPYNMPGIPANQSEGPANGFVRPNQFAAMPNSPHGRPEYISRDVGTARPFMPRTPATPIHPASHEIKDRNPIQPLQVSIHELPHVPTTLDNSAPFTPDRVQFLPQFKDERINRVVQLKASDLIPVGLLYSGTTFSISRLPLGDGTTGNLTRRWSGAGMANMVVTIGMNEGRGNEEWAIALRIRDWPAGQVARFPETQETFRLLHTLIGHFDLLPDGREKWYVLRQRDRTTGERYIKVIRAYVDTTKRVVFPNPAGAKAKNKEARKTQASQAKKREETERAGDRDSDEEFMRILRGHLEEGAAEHDTEPEEAEEDDHDNHRPKGRANNRLIDVGSMADQDKARRLKEWAATRPGVLSNDELGQNILRFMTEIVQPPPTTGGHRQKRARTDA